MDPNSVPPAAGADGVSVRTAVPDDAAACAAIYAPYVRDTAVTFELEPPDAAEIRRRIEKVLLRHPWIVAERGGGIAGFAYASPFRARPAYDRTAETTIYVRGGARGTGVGRRLYGELERLCAAQGILDLEACVAVPAPGAAPGDPHLPDASPAFHRRMGYAEVGRFARCGRKFGRWYGVSWMEKTIGPHAPDPPPFVPWTQLAGGTDAPAPAFRPMRRAGQALSEGDIRDVLRTVRRGVLAVTGDGGHPYCITLNPFYDEETGRLYFHGAKAGHKIDALRRDPRVCFTAIDDGVHDPSRPPAWALTFRSVVVHGHVEFVDDHEEALAVCRKLCRRFPMDEEAIEKEIRAAGAAVLVFALVPEHVSGKRVHEA